MALNYPDIIGDYLKSTQRFENSGLQYAGYFEPVPLVPGQVAHLFLFVQNTLNVPITANFQIEVPKSGGFFSSKKPTLHVEKTSVAVDMGQAEAGLFTLPVTTTDHTKQGDHALTIVTKVSAQGRGKRIRPKSATSQLDDKLIDTPVGLNLVSSVGATYTEKSAKKAQFVLKVAGKPEPLQRAPRLQASYESIWTEEKYQTYNKAVQELNSRQVKIKDDLNVEKLFVNLYAESVARFADAGLPLRIGEAIVLTKILTYSCHYFLSSPKRANGLLVPILENALGQNMDTTDILHVIRTAGYYHIIRLAVAVSYGLIANSFGRQYWTLEERQLVGKHIADCLETGQDLDLEFLYLPLLMGGTQIAKKVKLQGEELSHTVALMKTARDERKRLFIDQEMEKVDKIYNRILARALAA
jgi:hypothetical protein